MKEEDKINRDPNAVQAKPPASKYPRMFKSKVSAGTALQHEILQQIQIHSTNIPLKMFYQTLLTNKAPNRLQFLAPQTKLSPMEKMRVETK